MNDSALAVSFYALISLEIKAARLLKIYACVLVVFTIIDLCWLCMYTAAISTQHTGMSYGGFGVELAATLKWGPAATDINNWVCLSAGFISFFVRLASVPLWLLMWAKGSLDAHDAYEDMHQSAPVGPPRDYGRDASDPYGGDFSHVMPSGPVPSGRIQGHGGDRHAPQQFSGYSHGSGYQNTDEEAL